MRLFVGIALPEDIRDRLRSLSGGLPGARWVSLENLHLSLRFIGEVPGGDERDIFEALKALDLPAFELTLSGLGSFERRGRVYAVWAGVEKSEPLSHLQAKVAVALERTGFEPEHRKFKPHITLARLKGGKVPEVAQYLQFHGSFAVGPFRVAHFTLFRSYLGNGGSHYEALVEYPLKSPTPKL
ncbi:MAG: RNA 2',3'-cyclic phosphodiesterase [Rhodospirillales bacterium]|nr:RNA 2',3'-cyclic phosphodiesterase [Rhodospirillales bacterium]